MTRATHRHASAGAAPPGAAPPGAQVDAHGDTAAGAQVAAHDHTRASAHAKTDASANAGTQAQSHADTRAKTHTEAHVDASIVVELRGGVVAYNGQPVLRGVDLTVTRGEVVAILGANGSGKSTLVRALLGLLPLVAGTLALFGESQQRPQNWRPHRQSQLRRQWRRIGYVPQRLGAGAGVPATVAEVVSSGRLSRRRLLASARAADHQAVTTALQAVGLAELATTPVGTLSGGQQQRALIARALAAEPDLLVLDEPMSGVDAQSQVAFAQALARFVAQGGTAILVAHELGQLEPLVSRAVVIDSGTAREAPVPVPAAASRDPVHPHAPHDPPGIWSAG